MLDMVLVILPGVAIVLFGMLGLDWKQRIAKYGAPPPRHHWGTFIAFLVPSLVYVSAGWVYPDDFAGVVFLLLLILALDKLLFIDLIRFNFRELEWSRRQQARDGFVLATLFVFPEVFLHVARVTA